jgi:hypothetical protein
MTKGRAALPSGFDDEVDEPQVPSLRFAPVGMTIIAIAYGRDGKGLTHNDSGFDFHLRADQ